MKRDLVLIANEFYIIKASSRGTVGKRSGEREGNIVKERRIINFPKVISNGFGIFFVKIFSQNHVRTSKVSGESNRKKKNSKL